MPAMTQMAIAIMIILTERKKLKCINAGDRVMISGEEKTYLTGNIYLED